MAEEYLYGKYQKSWYRDCRGYFILWRTRILSSLLAIRRERYYGRDAGWLSAIVTSPHCSLKS